MGALKSGWGEGAGRGNPGELGGGEECRGGGEEEDRKQESQDDGRGDKYEKKCAHNIAQRSIVTKKGGVEQI